MVLFFRGLTELYANFDVVNFPDVADELAIDLHELA